MTNSGDPDQLTSSGSTLFAKTGHAVFSKRRAKRKNLLPFGEVLEDYSWVCVTIIPF